VATKNATAAVDSVVRSVADTGAMQVEALVRSMTTDEATVSTVLELVTMLLPEATAVTAMTVAQAVEVSASSCLSPGPPCIHAELRPPLLCLELKTLAIPSGRVMHHSRSLVPNPNP
jgi:hypothetical protein